MKTARLLIVDPDARNAALYRQALAGLGDVELIFESDTASARRQLEEHSFNLLIAAHVPPQVDALALLTRAREADADLPVVLVEQAPAIATAAAGLRLGASDYLSGPIVP
ncbi:MAG TPA: response regulator, partial [Pirellulales bacterium]|nr:response regulator [Pirellulales bacterium]